MGFSPLANLLAVVAALAALSALALLGLRRRRGRRLLRRLRRLLHHDAAATHARPGAEGPLARHLTALLRRAGVEPARWQAWTLAGTLAAAVLGGLWLGPAGLLPPLGVLGAAYLWLLHRAGARRRLMLSQLPSFIDHLVRAVHAGNTLDTAFASAVAEAPEPLRGALAPVLRELRLGGELEVALAHAARLYSLRELRLMTLAVAVNRRYGSSIHDLLKSVVGMIRRAEAARNELRALTGETRLSALVLGVLPLGVAVFILIVNPAYLQHLWTDPSGRAVLAAAVGLQAAGALILWRMIRSI